MKSERKREQSFERFELSAEGQVLELDFASAGRSRGVTREQGLFRHLYCH